MEYSSIEIRSSVFLLTRFNLNLFPKDKEGLSTRTEEWLNDRFRLFEKYCFPSVLNQSYKDFIWVVLFDDKTPDQYKKRIASYQDKMKNFLPVFFSSEEARNHKRLVNQVIVDYKDESPYLVTARVDNDDALHKDFIKNVSLLRKERFEDYHFFSFCRGIQYYTEENLAIKLHYKRNHFLVSVSSCCYEEKIKNILEFKHPNISDYGVPFTCVKNNEPMWIEVIHNHNVNNDCIMTFPQIPVFDNKILMRDFSWDIVLESRNTRNNFIFFFIPHFFSQFQKRISFRLAFILRLIICFSIKYFNTEIFV